MLGTGKILLKVPPTLRFVMDGEMPDYLLAKDLILQIIGEISVAGATYKAMEFVGTTVESLTMEERMTLCNMVVEAGGKMVSSQLIKQHMTTLREGLLCPMNLFIVMKEPDILRSTDLMFPSWSP